MIFDEVETNDVIVDELLRDAVDALDESGKIYAKSSHKYSLLYNAFLQYKIVLNTIFKNKENLSEEFRLLAYDKLKKIRLKLQSQFIDLKKELYEQRFDIIGNSPDVASELKVLKHRAYIEQLSDFVFSNFLTSSSTKPNILLEEYLDLNLNKVNLKKNKYVPLSKIESYYKLSKEKTSDFKVSYLFNSDYKATQLNSAYYQFLSKFSLFSNHGFTLPLFHLMIRLNSFYFF